MRTASTAPWPRLSKPATAIQRNELVRARDKPGVDVSSLRDGAVVGPILPSGIRPPAEDIVFVNGMHTSVALFEESMRALADSASGARVLGIYNGSDGVARDVLQGYVDHLSSRRNAAIAPLAKIIERALRDRKPLHIVAHSQGSAVVSQAIRLAHARLPDAPLALLRIETLGAAGCRFIDGPHYVHAVNSEDPVPHVMGVGAARECSTLHNGGQDATYRYFTARKPATGHSLLDRLDSSVHGVGVYAEHRERFDEVRSSGTPAEIPEAEARAVKRWSALRMLTDLFAWPITLRDWFVGDR